MTTTRGQLLLVDSELSKAHDFLFEPHILVTHVRSLFFNSDDFATAARLKDIEGRLADELRAVERLIAASKLGISSIERSCNCAPHVMAVIERGRARSSGSRCKRERTAPRP